MIKINPLFKRHWRLFKSKFGIYLSIFLMMFSIVVLMSGYFVTSNNIYQSTLQSQIDNKAEVASFIVDRTLSDNVIDKIKAEGFEINKNYYVDLRLVNNQVLRVFSQRDDINKEILLSGNFPNNNEIVLDRLFAEHNDLSLNEKLIVGNKEYRIAGFVALVDYSSLMRRSNDFIMDSYNFGVGVINPETFSAFKDEYVYNYSLYRTNDDSYSDKEKFDSSNNIKKILLSNGYNLSDYILKDNNKRLSFIVKDMQNVIPMMQTLMAIVFVIIAFVFRVLMKNIFDKESVMIGTLKANGYSNLSLILHYSFLPILLAVLAAVFGNIVGYTVFPEFYKSLYYSSYSIPPMNTYFNLDALILTTFIPLLIIGGMTFLTAVVTLSKTPLKLLRRESVIKSKLQPLKKSKLNFIWRFYIRVFFQNINAYVILMIGFVFANLMLMFGLALPHTLNNYIDKLEDNMFYKYQYFLKQPVEKIDYDVRSATVLEYVAKMPVTEHNLPIIVYGLDRGISYNGIKVRDDGVVISRGLADKLFLKLGDVLTVDNLLLNRSYSYPVVEINEKEGQFIIYLSKLELNQEMGVPFDYFNCIFSDHELNLADKYVSYSINPDDIANQGKQFNISFQKTNVVTISLSLLLYFVIVYNVAKSIVDHNSQSISYLKIFGYTDREISKLYLRMTLWAVIIGGLISCPIAFILYDKFLIFALYKMNVFLHGYVPFWHFFGIVTGGFIVYLLIQSYLVYRIKQIRMSDALKQID